MIATNTHTLPSQRPTERLICFSHLRWNFVTQRPQHLMTRFAATRDVVFWEEPVFGADQPHLALDTCAASGVTVAVPHLPEGTPGNGEAVRALLDAFLTGKPEHLTACYYTPMMLPFSRHLRAVATVYDCMDELANFAFAPPELLALEEELLARADVVFTGGYSLYEAKRGRHDNVYPFPSSVDVAHFAQARGLPRGDRSVPTVGFYGVIDERLDLALVAAVADARPGWRIEMVGPVVKISPDSLPMRPNLIWQGPADYAELPRVLAGWDVAIMPFALNAATLFISPTKTPEYLAAAKPVVSTAIVDVARHYGETPGVCIAENAHSFVAGIEDLLPLAPGGDWLAAVDRQLASMSWDETVARMAALIDEARADKAALKAAGGEHYDVLVVGAGFAGSVMAERLAADAGLKVLVVDRRPHIAGNAYDVRDAAGVLIHQYGPHIFHTNSDEVAAYLSRFTGWRPYEHRVLADVNGKRVPMPINRTTLNALYHRNLQTDAEAAAFLASRAEALPAIETSEDVVVAAIGRELYETFFRGYTRKQWGLDPSQLDKSVTSRVPTRTNTDDRYFIDSFQAMPAEGYTRMFERMLAHPNITLRLGADYRALGPTVTYDRMVYTGPVDEFFDCRFGKLPYRSLRFKHETHACERFQDVATVNYPSEDVPFTRITEYKHLTGETGPKTSITYEFPCAEGDPYYPVPRAENELLYRRYRALADAEANVTFVGRLATYRYYNMDQVVAQALATYRRLKPELTGLVDAVAA